MYAQHSARKKATNHDRSLSADSWVNFEPNRRLSSLAKLCSMQKFALTAPAGGSSGVAFLG